MLLKNKKRFIYFYWLVIIVCLLLYLIKDGTERKRKYAEAKGEVIGQIYVTKGGRFGNVERLRPQISYRVGEEEYFFVDHFTERKTGSTPVVLYKKSNPQEAQIYTWLFWVDSGIIIPVLIVSGFVFSIIWINITKYGNKGVILKGKFNRYPEEKS